MCYLKKYFILMFKTNKSNDCICMSLYSTFEKASCRILDYQYIEVTNGYYIYNEMMWIPFTVISIFL